jgi:hypothetical protein
MAAVTAKFNSLLAAGSAVPTSGDGKNYKTWSGPLQADLQDPWLAAYSLCPCTCLCANGDISRAAPFEGSPLEDACSSVCICLPCQPCHSQCAKQCFPFLCLNPCILPALPCCTLTCRAWWWGACPPMLCGACTPFLRSQLAKSYGIRDPYDSMLCCCFLNYLYCGSHYSRVQQLYEIKYHNPHNAQGGSAGGAAAAAAAAAPAQQHMKQ